MGLIPFPNMRTAVLILALASSAAVNCETDAD